MSSHQKIFLGIETSCDETAAAVVTRSSKGEGTILSNVVYTQLEEHSAYGGVVPEIAARAHIEILDELIKTAITESSIKLNQLDAIAATAGPGLSGGLLVGLMTAKALCFAGKKPLFAINHLEGHALSARLTDNINFPYLLLLVSGGHSQVVLVKNVDDYKRWATTIDDALGEAFDKTAKLLGLDYPGGPAVEKAAKHGDKKRFNFPLPMRNSERLDFSFSGLKTAVRQTAQNQQPLTSGDIDDICASFQFTICRVLENRLKKCLEKFKTEFQDVKAPKLVIAGGVAANQEIRASLTQLCIEYDFEMIAPPMHLCTDNAAMIAWAALERDAVGINPDKLDIAPRSRWPLDQDAKALLGGGKRGAKA